MVECYAETVLKFDLELPVGEEIRTSRLVSFAVGCRLSRLSPRSKM